VNKSVLNIPSFSVMRPAVRPVPRFRGESAHDVAEVKRIRMLSNSALTELPNKLAEAMDEGFPNLMFAVCQRLVVTFPHAIQREQLTTLKELSSVAYSRRDLAEKIPDELLDALARTLKGAKYVDKQAHKAQKISDLYAMSSLNGEFGDLNHMEIARFCKQKADRNRLNIADMGEDMLMRILAMDPSPSSAQEIRDIFNGVGENIPEVYHPGRTLEQRLNQLLD
jgi:hypothetical protein